MSAERSHFCVYHTPGLSPQPGCVQMTHCEEQTASLPVPAHSCQEAPWVKPSVSQSLHYWHLGSDDSLWKAALLGITSSQGHLWHLILQRQSRSPQSFDNQKCLQTNVSRGHKWPFFPSWQSLVFGTRKQVVTFAPDSGPSGWCHITSHLLLQTLSVPSWIRVTKIERNNVFEHVQWVITHDEGAVTILRATKMPIALGSLCVSRSC